MASWALVYNVLATARNSSPLRLVRFIPMGCKVVPPGAAILANWENERAYKQVSILGILTTAYTRCCQLYLLTFLQREKGYCFFILPLLARSSKSPPGFQAPGHVGPHTRYCGPIPVFDASGSSLTIIYTSPAPRLYLTWPNSDQHTRCSLAWDPCEGDWQPVALEIEARTMSSHLKGYIYMDILFWKDVLQLLAHAANVGSVFFYMVHIQTRYFFYFFIFFFIYFLTPGLDWTGLDWTGLDHT